MAQEEHGEKEEKDRTGCFGVVSKGVQRKETHKGASEGTAREVGGKTRENSSWKPTPQSVHVAPVLGKNQMEQTGGQVEPGAGLGSSEEFSLVGEGSTEVGTLC